MKCYNGYQLIQSTIEEYGGRGGEGRGGEGRGRGLITFFSQKGGLLEWSLIEDSRYMYVPLLRTSLFVPIIFL